MLQSNDEMNDYFDFVNIWLYSIKSNNKKNKIVVEKSEESSSSTFSLQDLGELSTSFLSCFKSVCTNCRGSHKNLFKCY